MDLLPSSTCPLSGPRLNFGRRPLRLAPVAAAKKAAQPQKPRRRKGYQPKDEESGLASTSAAPARPQVITQQQADEDAGFEERLKAIAGRVGSAQQAEPSGDEHAAQDRQDSGRSASSSGGTPPQQRSSGRPSPSKADADKASGPLNSWVAQAGVAAGALVLTGVFVFATVGVDFGFNGRRQSSSPPQARELSEQEKAGVVKQAEDLEAQYRSDKGLQSLRVSAQLFASSDKLDKAAGLLEEITKAEPSDDSAWQNLGEVRLRQGDTRGAVAAYERAAAESRTENAALLSGLTRVLIRDGRAPDAIERIKAVQRRAGSSSAGLGYYEASMLLGKAYSGWGNHSGEALEVYGELIAKYPDDFRAFLAKGIVLKEAGRKGDAQRMFLQARYLAPPNARDVVDELAAR